jgi:hypothetical protein
MKRNVYFLILFLSFFTLQGSKGSIGIEDILDKFQKEQYIAAVKTMMIEELYKCGINANDYIKKESDMNILIIPQFSINCEEGKVVFDSLNPINRAVLFKRQQIIGTLLFIEKEKKIFCPSKITNLTNFDCGKYICREPYYYKSLKFLLKKSPIFIFKDKNYERLWFFIDKNQDLFVLTYDMEIYSAKVFFQMENLSEYKLLDNVLIKDFKQ